MGATALAGSTALARKPVRQGRFSVVDKQTYQKRVKAGLSKPIPKGQRPVRFKRNTRVHGQIDVQERRARARPERRRRQRVTTLRGAGTLATVSGVLLPTLAYGYVASSYLDPLGILRGEPGAVKSDALVKDAAWINTQIVGDIYTAMKLIDAGSTVASGIIGTIKETL